MLKLKILSTKAIKQMWTKKLYKKTICINYLNIIFKIIFDIIYVYYQDLVYTNNQ